MQLLQRMIGNEQIIKNNSGNVEFVVLPVVEYEKILEIFEDYGLGLAIKEAEKDKIYSKEEAQKILNNA